MDTGKGKKKIYPKKTKEINSKDKADAVADVVADATINTDDFEYQQLINLQSEADAEYARQLAEEFAAETNQATHQASGPVNNPENLPEDLPEDLGDDMDTVLEEIARMEAVERLKATGNAYNGKPNINRILADEDEEESRIREKVKRKAELREWRQERERQDAEYAAAEEQDRMQELSKKVSNTSNIDIDDAPDVAPDDAPDDAPDAVLIPLSIEDLRRARLARFCKSTKILN
jgi:hypothetical protein